MSISNCSNDDLRNQLKRLEATSARQRIALAIQLVAFCAYCIFDSQRASDATFDTITCKQWQVVDSNGMIRIEAKTQSKGMSRHPQAEIVLTDHSGAERVSAMTNIAFSGVVIKDAREKWRIESGVHEAIDPTIGGKAATQWLDGDERRRGYISANDNGIALMEMLDADESVRMKSQTSVHGCTTSWIDAEGSDVVKVFAHGNVRDPVRVVPR